MTGAVISINIILTVITIFKIQKIYTISYAFGGWLPPVGIEYKVDHLTTLLLCIIAIVSLLSFLQSINFLQEKIENQHLSSFYALFLFSMAGFIGIVMANDLFNIYVFLEIASLSAYGLVAIGNDKALIAAFQYLIIGSIAALFILFGIGLLYMMSGTLNITDLSQKLTNKIGLIPVKYGIIFIVTGVLLKMAFFPMHLWLANIYAYSPSFVKVFLSGITSKICLYLLLRVIFNIVGIEEFYINFSGLIICLKIMSYMAIVFGSIYAILNINIYKVLAFSTISQLGYMVLAIVHTCGMESLFLLMIGHSLTKSTLLMCNENQNLCYKKSLTNICIAFNVASLIGIPITLGFTSKWLLLSSLAKQEAWVSFICIVIGGVLTAFYGWKILVSNMMRNYSIVFATFLNFIVILNSKNLTIYSKLIAKTLLKGYR